MRNLFGESEYESEFDGEEDEDDTPIDRQSLLELEDARVELDKMMSKKDSEVEAIVKAVEFTPPGSARIWKAGLGIAESTLKFSSLTSFCQFQRRKVDDKLEVE